MEANLPPAKDPLALKQVNDETPKQDRRITYIIDLLVNFKERTHLDDIKWVHSNDNTADVNKVEEKMFSLLQMPNPTLVLEENEYPTLLHVLPKFQDKGPLFPLDGFISIATVRGNSYVYGINLIMKQIESAIAG